MRKLAAVLAVASIIGVGASMAGAEDYKDDSAKKVDPAPAGDADTQKAYPADNSGINARDAGDGTVTADDQSNAKVDVEITQNIRKAVVADDSLSTNAKNVKIITQGGIVTLRGPVKNESERASVAAKAKSVAGVARVNNQLEVETQ